MALEAELKEKRVAYRDTMREVADLKRQRYQQGVDDIDAMLEAQIALAEAELAAASSSDARLAALEALFERLKESESFQQARMVAGAGRTDELIKAKAGRLFGEIMILEERRRQLQQ